jgi:hypothetical protein
LAPAASLAPAAPSADTSRSSASINVALSDLAEFDSPFSPEAKPEAKADAKADAKDATPGAPEEGPAAAKEAPAFALPGLGDDDVHLNISEPSQLIDLASLAEAMHPSAPAAGGLLLPGVPDEPLVAPASPVMVVAGPAPTDQTRQLKVVLFGAIAAVVLLLGTVAYLLLRHPAEDGTAQAPRRDEGRAVTDHPVAVSDDPGRIAPQAPTVQAADGGVKKGGGVKKAPRLPQAANGKAEISGNAEKLAQLYGDGAGTTPKLPAAAPVSSSQGGGASEAELQNVLRTNQKSLTSCYDRVLKHDESLRRARIDVHVQVGMSGTVTHVTIGAPYGGTELGTCMQQTIRRWHFPSSDADYETQFPLILTAS